MRRPSGSPLYRAISLRLSAHPIDILRGRRNPIQRRCQLGACVCCAWQVTCPCRRIPPDLTIGLATADQHIRTAPSTTALGRLYGNCSRATALTAAKRGAPAAAVAPGSSLPQLDEHSLHEGVLCLPPLAAMATAAFEKVSQLMAQCECELVHGITGQRPPRIEAF